MWRIECYLCLVLFYFSFAENSSVVISRRLLRFMLVCSSLVLLHFLRFLGLHAVALKVLYMYEPAHAKFMRACVRAYVRVCVCACLRACVRLCVHLCVKTLRVRSPPSTISHVFLLLLYLRVVTNSQMCMSEYMWWGEKKEKKGIVTGQNQPLRSVWCKTRLLNSGGQFDRTCNLYGGAIPAQGLC